MDCVRNYINTTMKVDINSETSHRRSMNSKWSTIWSYYDKLDDKAICKICGITMKYNTIRHLKRLHPIAYKEWQNELKKINELTEDEDSDVDSTTLPSKPKSPMKRSSIWLFYKICNGKALCNICGFDMRNNKIRHLKKKHPAAYKEWRKIREKNNEYPWLIKGVDTCKRRNRNEVWLFFKRVDGLSVCNTCGVSIKYNKVRHLQKRHPTVYNKLESIRKKNKQLRLLAKERLCSIWVKKYINKIDINKYRCELCHTHIKMRENEYSNMKRHIRFKHPYIYDQEMKECKETEKNKFAQIRKSVDDVVEYVVEYIENDPLIDDGDLIDNISKSKETELKDNDENPDGSLISTDVEETEKNEELKHSDDSEDTDDTDDNLEQSEILRDNDPLLEDKIEQLCVKHLGDKRQRNKTCFWNFFDVLDENHIYRCLFCGREVAIYPGSISNLKRHIENKHNWQYKLILKYAPERDTCNTSKFKQTKRSLSENASDEKFNLVDRDRFKCKICEEMIICGDDKKILFDHFVEEHLENVIKGNSEELPNAESEYKVIIDADDDTYIIAI